MKIEEDTREWDIVIEREEVNNGDELKNVPLLLLLLHRSRQCGRCH